MFAMNILTAEY